MTPPFPLAIQCITENEAKQVARTLQGIADASPPGADYKQLLAAFDIPSVRTLFRDDVFYAIVIGSPPGIHRTA